MCENLNEAGSAKFWSRDALMVPFFSLNSLTPKKDKHLISPKYITPEENKENESLTEEALNFWTNSPCHHLANVKRTVWRI